MEQDKYTARTLAALQSAQQIAAMRYHQEITSAHVLLTLAKEPEGLLATIFEVCRSFRHRRRNERPADAQGTA